MKTAKRKTADFEQKWPKCSRNFFSVDDTAAVVHLTNGTFSKESSGDTPIILTAVVLEQSAPKVHLMENGGVAEWHDSRPYCARRVGTPGMYGTIPESSDHKLATVGFSAAFEDKFECLLSLKGIPARSSRSFHTPGLL